MNTIEVVVFVGDEFDGDVVGECRKDSKAGEETGRARGDDGWREGEGEKLFCHAKIGQVASGWWRQPRAVLYSMR